LTNPPFGGKEGKDAQKNFDFETGATQALFVQSILSELAPDGRCGIVLDEGLLFRTNETAFVETKRKLVDECDLWAIVSLPGGVFSTAGAGVKTNLLFFTKGKKTGKTWYYDISRIKVGKKTPMTLAYFGFGKNGEILDDSLLPTILTSEWQADNDNQGKPFPSFARLLPNRGTPDGESPYSWTVDFAAKRAQAHTEMQPYLDQVAQIKEQVVTLKEKLKALKKDKGAPKRIEALEGQIREQEKEARDAQSKADNIDAAVFDLKAVNPNAVVNTEIRTPAEIIENIQVQGKIVTVALEKLKVLLKEPI